MGQIPSAMGVRTFARIFVSVYFRRDIQCAKEVLRLAMEYANGDKYEIVFTSPEAMVGFSGGKKVKT